MNEEAAVTGPNPVHLLPTVKAGVVLDLRVMVDPDNLPVCHLFSREQDAFSLWLCRDFQRLFFHPQLFILIFKKRSSTPFFRIDFAPCLCVFFIFIII